MRLSLRRKNEYTKQPQKAAEVNIMRLMLPSILGMLLCAVCLAGTTWAWFTATSSVDKNIGIKAAEFIVDVKFDSNEGVTQSGDTYNITADKVYTVTLEATGTASEGYCSVTVDGDSYSARMGKGETISFTVCSSNGKLEVVTSWNEMNDANLSAGKYIGKGVVPTSEDEDSKDQVKAKPKDTEDSKPEQGNDNTPAHTDEPKEAPTEPENSSEAGE